MSGGDIRMIVIFLILSGGLLFLFRDQVQQFLSTPSKAPARPAVALNPDAHHQVLHVLEDVVSGRADVTRLLRGREQGVLQSRSASRFAPVVRSDNEASGRQVVPVALWPAPGPTGCLRDGDGARVAAVGVGIDQAVDEPGRPWHPALGEHAGQTGVGAGVGVEGLARQVVDARAVDLDQATIADLGFLRGSWSAPQGPSEVEEHWTAPKAGTMIGMNRTTRGDRTAAFEFLRIVTRPDGLYYMASPGGRPPTPFKLAELSKDNAAFLNPKHDFPQKILYWREGASLCAAIEGPMQGETVRESWCWKPASAR